MAEASRSKAKHCEGTRLDGQPCLAPVMGTGASCYAHDPARAVERAEARQRGGHNRATHIRLAGFVPDRLQPVFELLAVALTDVQSAKITPSQASAMASVARAMVATFTAGEMEERLRRLEADAGELPR